MLRPVDKETNMFKHSYEMIMIDNTKIIPCLENYKQIPLKYDFCPISQIENKQEGDIIGINVLIKIL